MNRKLVIGTAVLGGSLLLVGCTEKSKEPFRDAPVGARNNSPAAVVENPDGFSNVAHKCIAPGIRVVVAYKGDDNRAAIAAVQDPNCK